MRILVTGGAGFIGSALVRHLVENTNHQVLNLDKLTYAGTLSTVERVAGSNRYRFVQGGHLRCRRGARSDRGVPAGGHHASRRRKPCRPLD